MDSSAVRRDRGFTLLELLIVIAIIAAIAGVAVAAYEGLDQQAEKGQATFNIAAVDRAIRTFKVANNGAYPDDYDALVTNGGPPAFYAGMSPKVTSGSPPASPKLQLHTLQAREVAALANAGIRNLRFIDTAGGQPNAVGTIPNRDFDLPGRGKGISTPIAAGTTVCRINPARLRDIAGYPLASATSADVVLVFGVGNNCTLVRNEGSGLATFSGGLSEAPIYASAGKNQYSRFLALYVVTRDFNGDGTIADADGDGIIEQEGDEGSPVVAQFVAVLDTFGDWYDEEYAEYTGQKPITP